MLPVQVSQMMEMPLWYAVPLTPINRLVDHSGIEDKE
jgi:hypothetical protein